MINYEDLKSSVKDFKSDTSDKYSMDNYTTWVDPRFRTVNLLTKDIPNDEEFKKI